MDFRDQLFMFLWKIDKKENFALARYWDWERAIMLWEEIGLGTQAQAQDNWTSYGKSKLWEALLKTLLVDKINYFYAIPCQCCNNQWKLWYKENIVSENFTFANIFINNNYQYFKERLKTIDREVIMIANYEWAGKEYPFKVDKYYPVPDDCVNYFDKNWKQMIELYRSLARMSNNELFFISAWPLANIIVYEMYRTNPNNTYIDLWSALDEWTKGRITRWFQRREDSYAKKYCVF